MRRADAVLASLVLALVAGPVAASAPPVIPAASDPIGLDGTWLVTGYQAAGGPWVSPPVVTARAPEITFNIDGTYWGYTGCNSFSGDYVVDGATLALSEASSTLMYCGEGDAAWQETAILALLDAAVGWRANPGSLQLTGPSGVVLLAGTAVDATVVRAWMLRLDSLPGAPRPSDEPSDGLAPQPSKWTLTMAADGTFASDAGCDPVVGIDRIDGTTVHFEVPGGTRSSCDAEHEAQRAATLAILAAATGYVVNPYSLTLLDAAGSILAEFHAPDKGA